MHVHVCIVCTYIHIYINTLCDIKVVCYSSAVYVHAHVRRYGSAKLCCFCSIMSTSDEFTCNCETVNIVIIYTLLIVTFTHLHVHNVNSATVPVK